MTDEAAPKHVPENPEAGLPVQAPAPEEVEASVFGLPVSMFVKGGTSTSAHDRQVAADEADAERRRAIADAERQAAKDHGIAAGDPDSVSTLYSHEFTEHPEFRKAYVLLHYMGRGGREVEHIGVGDIIMPDSPMFKDELAILLFCPKCKERLPASQCICTVRQGNRKWELDRRSAGELFVFEGQSHRSAGKVMDSEKFTCPRCPWSARIDDNRVIQY